MQVNYLLVVSGMTTQYLFQSWGERWIRGSNGASTGQRIESGSVRRQKRVSTNKRLQNSALFFSAPAEIFESADDSRKLKTPMQWVVGSTFHSSRRMAGVPERLIEKRRSSTDKTEGRSQLFRHEATVAGRSRVKRQLKAAERSEIDGINVKLRKISRFYGR